MAPPDSSSALEQDRGRGGPTDPAHDALLRRGVLHTRVSRRTAAGLCALFLLMIYGVPIAQGVLEWRADDPSSLTPLFERAPSRENLAQFEHDLEEASYLKSYVQPRLQLLLTGLGGAGNKRVVVGDDGFLFYTPGLMHLCGPSFLERDVIATKERVAREQGGGEALHADPLPAILAFQRMLAARGITLVLFPVPDKTMLQPRQLRGGGVVASRPANNPGWTAFSAALARAGVKLFDPTPRALMADEPARYLVQDTHWTPAYMQQVARELAQFIRGAVALPPAPPARALRVVEARAARVGDLVDMLKLPEDQQLFAPQSVTVEALRDDAGEPWEPNPEADVLLLGDSFTNIFTADAMAWGEAAGLGPQLSRALGRDIDVIAQNDAGAHATREALFRQLQAGDDRLAGKRVVIWELAARELSVGDFKPLAWESLPGASAR